VTKGGASDAGSIDATARSCIAGGWRIWPGRGLLAMAVAVTAVAGGCQAGTGASPCVPGSFKTPEPTSSFPSGWTCAFTPAPSRMAPSPEG
jgi:hypothetical protein